MSDREFRHIMNPENTYALITPAKNEDRFIGRTIESILTQTVRPRKWIIVSDGSTDGTDEIVSAYAEQHDFINLLRTDNRKRSFSAKAEAIKTGYQLLRDSDYRFVGNVDADVTFEPDYFEALLGRFAENRTLGIAGGIISELHDGKYTEQKISLNSVAGAVQLFSRECFEQIGGYRPIPTGGIDAVAEIMARMHGWEVRTFPDLVVRHHRRVGTGTSDIIKSRFRQGIRDRALGYHPLFYLVSSGYRITAKPFFLASVLRVSGFFWAAIMNQKKCVPEEVIRFLRKEQMKRLSRLFLFKTSPVN